MKKTILTAVFCCLLAGLAGARENSETVRTDKVYVSLGGGTQVSLNLRFIDVGGQFELGWWFSPYTAVAINAGGNFIIGRNSADADEIFNGNRYDLQARLLGLLDFTNLFLGEEEGARNKFHILGYAGLGKIGTQWPPAWNGYYFLPSAGIDLSDRISRHLSIYGRAGVNLYHPLHDITPYLEASIGFRVGLGKGRTYEKDPNQAYKDDIAALERELEKERQNIKVKTDTVVVTETQEVEKVVRDTVIMKINQVDTLTIYDVVEVAGGVPVKADTVYVKADTVYIKSLPEILVKTVYADSASAAPAAPASVEPVVLVDTVYVVSEPEVQVQVQTDTVFVQTEPEIQVQVQTDTVFVPSDPEIFVRTVYVNKEPIVLRDTVFVATDPEVQIQTVYRDKEPVVLVDTVFVQSEPEIEVRTVYREREVVKVQKDTVFLELEPEVQVKVVKDTVFVPSEPEIMVRTVYVNKEPVIVKDTVFVASDPEVKIQTVYRDKEPIIVKDTVFVQSEPEIEIRYRDREVVKEVIKVQTDTVVVEKDPVVQVDTVVIEKDPIVQVDTVIIEKDPVMQTDTVLVKVPVEPETTLIYVVFPENAAWVNYGARKQLDKIAKEIKENDGDVKYLLIAPVSPDSQDPVQAYNLGVRRVSQVRLHLIRENGVDSRKLRETVLVSPAGHAVEDGNAFVIVAREDDPRINEILGQ